MTLKPTHVVVLEHTGSEHSVVVDGANCSVANTVVSITPLPVLFEYLAEWNGALVPVFVETDGIDHVRVSFRGYSFDARILKADHHALLAVLHASAAMRTRTVRVLTPMPGLLKSILVRDGSSVRKGEPLFTLEAMKMENAIVAPINGVVRELAAVEGQAMEKGSKLCTIEPAAEVR